MSFIDDNFDAIIDSDGDWNDWEPGEDDRF